MIGDSVYAPAKAEPNLLDARTGHTTKLIRKLSDPDPAEAPPAGVLKLVKYSSPAGDLAAYITPDPGDGKKRPAILWIFGGFDNGIGSTAWKKVSPKNDQSAAVFREFGIVMMYPSFRGGSGNPGQVESFYGEVDDVLAAAKYLAAQPHVDPKRIYLGGHSTGGTLALLAAEATDRFRAVFSFGPVGAISHYGKTDGIAFDINDKKENELRSPIYHLKAVRSPTFVLEGTASPSNKQSIDTLKKVKPPSTVRFIEVDGVNHFSILAPVTRLLAEKIAADAGDVAKIEITMPEIRDAVGKAASQR